MSVSSWRPWARRFSLVVAAGVLSACSVVGLLYQQAPRLASTWLNDQVQLSDSQRDWLNPALDDWLDWHRQNILPTWLATGRDWAQQAQRDWTSDEVCAALQGLRDQAKATLDHSLPMWTRLALSLSPAQQRRLAEQRRESLNEFHADFIAAPPQAVLDERLTRAVDNWERLYGDLSDAQIDWLRTRLQASPWSPAQSWQRRRLRDQALLDLIAQLQAQGLNQAQAQTRLQSWLDAQWSPDDPDAQARQAAFWAHTCATVADFHRQSTPAQRQHLADTLRGYADDLDG